MRDGVNTVLTPSQLKDFLVRVGADRILVLGPPGVGKSTAIKEYAIEKADREGLTFTDLTSHYEGNTGKAYLYLHLYAPLLRAEDLAFPANIGEGKYDWVLPAKIESLTTGNVQGLVFIDELTNAQLPDVQTLLLSMILDKRVSHRRLSDKVEVIAAGNTPEDSPLAVALPQPLIDRFRMVVQIGPPTVEEWIEWMERQGRPWDRRVEHILKRRPDIMLSPAAGDGLEKTPTPRSWSQLAWDLALLGPSAPKELVERVVSYSIGSRYASLVTSMLEDLGGQDALHHGSSSQAGEAEMLRAIEERAGEMESRGVDCGFVDRVALMGAHYLAYLLALLPRRRREAASCRQAAKTLRDLERESS